MKRWLLLFSLVMAPLLARESYYPLETHWQEPWGEDAELAHVSKNVPQPHRNLLVKGAQKLIGFHRNVISKSDGKRSHFAPSSSEYTSQAMGKYGFFKGFIMGCDRLMRENGDPWLYPTVLVDGRELKENVP